MFPILSVEEFIKKIPIGACFWIVENRNPEEIPIIPHVKFISLVVRKNDKKESFCVCLKLLTLMSSDRVNPPIHYLDKFGFLKLFCLDEFGIFLSKEKAELWMDMRKLEFERSHIELSCALLE